MKGYKGYQHVSCISINDEVVHGVPGAHKIFKSGDVVKVDVCASWNGYCADMARIFLIDSVDSRVKKMAEVAEKALFVGITQARAGNHLSDISAAIQAEVESKGLVWYGILLVMALVKECMKTQKFSTMASLARVHIATRYGACY